MPVYDEGRSLQIGGGLLFFEELQSDGSYGDKIYFGPTQGVSVTTAVEFMSSDNFEGCVALPEGRTAIRKEAALSIQSTTINPTNLGRAFMGSVTADTQAAVTAQAVTLASADVTVGAVADYGYLGATTVVVKDATDTTTYVEGTDYELVAKAGYLIPLSGGAISTGDELHLTVTAPDFDGATIAAMKLTDLQGRFTLVTNSATGNNYEYTFKKCTVTQDGEFALKNIGTEPTTISYSGSVLVDPTVASSGTLSQFFDVKALPGSTCETVSE